ncbi:mucin-22-like [Gracilinanus agilis]|uniref:mucin-22-like n=1 Tax=Gracilinanus agilis TaxID=191870 RepID=UPI001CFC69C6|nr:mucin-22-like [Gracilinanus agilis]
MASLASCALVLFKQMYNVDRACLFVIPLIPPSADVNNTDHSVNINSTEITRVTPGGMTTSERIFETTRLYETSAVTHTPLKSKTSLAFETLAPARTTYKAEKSITESFPPMKTLIIMDALDETETTTLLESTNPTVTVVSESGIALGKTHSQAETLMVASSATEAEMAIKETLVLEEVWLGMNTPHKADWKQLNKPVLLSLPPPQNHGKHAHHHTGRHVYLDWTFPENYKTTIKTPSFTEGMTTMEILKESETSNPFTTIDLKETSGIIVSPETNTAIMEEVISCTIVDLFTETADIIEREGTLIETTTLPGTLVTVSPIPEATILTTNLIDTFPTAGNTQEIRTATATTSTTISTNTKAKTSALQTGPSAEILDGNNSQPNTRGEETTSTGDLKETIRTGTKTTLLLETSMPIDSSTEEGMLSLFKTIFSSEPSTSSSSAEEESSAAVEILTTANMITMAVPTTVETPDFIETLDTTIHTVESTTKMVTDPLNTIYFPITEETMAPIETTVFTEVPSTVTISPEEGSKITKFTTSAEFSNKVDMITEGTTASGISSSIDKILTSIKTPTIISARGKQTTTMNATTALMSQNTKADPNQDGGILLLRLIVSSSLDLTDFKVAKGLLSQVTRTLGGRWEWMGGE